LGIIAGAVAIQPPSLKCPQCGAPIEPVEDSPFLSCPFCATRIFIDASHAVLHFMVEPRLDAVRATEALGRWLRDREVVGSIVPSASELVFFPMWQVTSRGSTRIVAAAGALFEGLEKIQIPAGDQKVFSAERARGVKGEAARVVEAAVPLESALARAVARDAGPDPAGARLVHVPLFLLDYSFYGMPYRAAVDAASGQIYPITAPRSSESRIDVAFAGLLAAGLAANLIALLLFKTAPVASIALLAGCSWGLYAIGMRLARWMES
jgi:DNA-directed RNA polymerase subunit RPC12/RpoP